MKFYIGLWFYLLLINCAATQYHAQYRSEDLFQPQQGGQAAPQDTTMHQPVQAQAPVPVSYATTPTPAILLHKQTLTHDGGFNFAFTADNGLQQGESIQPDGTRIGGYSYVDPNGKTISVRYTAGKDGFKILEGEHVPGSHGPQQRQQQQEEAQTPTQTAPDTPQIPAQQPYQQYSSPQTFISKQYDSNGDGAQFRDAYNRPQQYGPSPPLPRYLFYKNVAANVNTIPQEQEHYDEPGKPHSFGNGYSFEFSG